MARVAITYDCGCQESINSLEEAKNHVAYTGHKITIHGFITPTDMEREAAQNRKSKARVHVTKPSAKRQVSLNSSVRTYKPGQSTPTPKPKTQPPAEDFNEEIRGGENAFAALRAKLNKRNR